MGQYGELNNFLKGGGQTLNLSMGLESAVANLNAKAKQAIYGAAMSKTIHQGTWNGCAFNAAGSYLGNPSISSMHAAADAFDLPVSAVRRFIEVWDGLQGSEEENTEKLIHALEEVGLFTDKREKRPPRVFRKTIMTSKENELLVELKEDIAACEVSGMNEIGALLFA